MINVKIMIRYWFYKDHDFGKWKSFNLMINQGLEYCIILYIIIWK